MTCAVAYAEIHAAREARARGDRELLRGTLR